MIDKMKIEIEKSGFINKMCFVWLCDAIFSLFGSVGLLLLPFRESRTDVREKILLFALAVR